MSLKQVALALCLFVIHESLARADSYDDIVPHRELGGHVYFPSLIVSDPFVSTYIALFTGAGYEWIDGPDFDSLGDRISTSTTRSYRAAAMAQGATFQATLTDFMALRITGGGGLDGGSNARSALVVGMIQPLTAGVGTTLAWNLAPNIRFGGTFDFVYARTRLIRPLIGIQDSLIAGDVQAVGVSEKLDSYSVLPGLTLAMTPCPSLGLLASARYNWTSQTDDMTTHSQYVSLGVSGQLDLLPDTGVGLGLLASYLATIPFESQARFTNTLEGGIFYTGRKSLDLGLDVQGKWLDLDPQHLVRLDTIQLLVIAEIRYHWN